MEQQKKSKCFLLPNIRNQMSNLIFHHSDVRLVAHSVIVVDSLSTIILTS